MVKPPGHTCPWIDQLQTLIRKNMKGEDRKRALQLCDELRGANLQLRLAYSDALKELLNRA
jgi:hypothetical protein